MAIKGRTQYIVYLDANDVELVRKLWKSAKYKAGLTGFVHDSITKLANEIRLAVENNEIDDLIDDWELKGQ